MMTNKKIDALPTILFYLLVLMIWYFPLFYMLDAKYLTLWDESRLSVNAVEMLQSGNWLTTTFDGQPDHWHTKPPMMIWLQVLSIKLLGINELAVRLPSALAGLATLIYVFIFIYKQSEHQWVAFGGSFILVTAGGFTGDHVTRNGDTDALLCFFTTVMVLESYRYITTLNKKNLIWAGVAVCCAILTKSIQGLIFLPAIILFAVSQQKMLPILKRKEFWVVLPLVFLLPALYYFLRNKYDPGYWDAVMENELWGRFGKTIEGHNHPFIYYFELIGQKYFYPQLIFGMIALILFLLPAVKSKFFTLESYLIGCTFTYLIIISVSATKLEWYTAPLYPLWSVWIALGFFAHLIKQGKYAVMSSLMVAFSFGYIYNQKMNGIITLPETNMPGVLYGPYLNQYYKERTITKPLIAYTDDYTACLIFYKYRIKAEFGKDVEVIRFDKKDLQDGKLEFQPNSIIAYRDDPMKPYLDQRYEYNDLYSISNFHTAEIIRKK